MSTTDRKKLLSHSDVARLLDVHRCTLHRWRYDRSIDFEPLGINVYFNSTPDRGRSIHAGRCCLDVPGGAIDLLSPEDQRWFMRGYNGKDLK